MQIAGARIPAWLTHHQLFFLRDLYTDPARSRHHRPGSSSAAWRSQVHPQVPSLLFPTKERIKASCNDANFSPQRLPFAFSAPEQTGGWDGITPGPPTPSPSPEAACQQVPKLQAPQTGDPGNHPLPFRGRETEAQKGEGTHLKRTGLRSKRGKNAHPLPATLQATGTYETCGLSTSLLHRVSIFYEMVCFLM